MTVESAAARLSAEVEQLWSAVSELMLIVAEDQPQVGNECPGLAVADHLVETVSEIQGDIAAARGFLERDGTDGLVAWGHVGDHLFRASRRLRHQLRAHRPIAQLRAAVRRRGGQWPGWCASVEESAEQCQDRFDTVDEAIAAALHELAQIAALSLGPHTFPSPVSGTPESQENRRIS